MTALKPIYIPKYKYALSYVFEQKLLSIESEYSGLLEVILSAGRLRLNTANATYSFEDKYDAFFDTFKALHFEKRTIGEALILGFGLGSIPVMLQKNFGQNAHYRAVEIDSVIIDLAKQLLDASVLLQISFCCADAFEFVQQQILNTQATAHQYDLIAIDIFNDLSTPPPFFSEQFLQPLTQLLSPKGVLLFNTLRYDAVSNKQSEQFFKNTFAHIFPNATFINTSGNRVLVYQK